MPSVIIICDCSSNFQDETYGKNKRVANIRDSKPQECTCTVCGKVRASKLNEQKKGNISTKK